MTIKRVVYVYKVANPSSPNAPVGDDSKLYVTSNLKGAWTNPCETTFDVEVPDIFSNKYIIKNAIGRTLKPTNKGNRKRVQRNYSLQRIITAASGSMRDTVENWWIADACHFNGDPSDNCLANLRWDTPNNNRIDEICKATMRKIWDEAKNKTTDNQDLIAFYKRLEAEVKLLNNVKEKEYLMDLVTEVLESHLMPQCNQTLLPLLQALKLVATP